MKQWYYAYNNQQQGPISEPDLANLLVSRQLASNTMLWSEGMANWQMAQDLNEFRHLFAAPPPPPLTPSPPPYSPPPAYQQLPPSYTDSQTDGKSNASGKIIMILFPIIGAIIGFIASLPNALKHAKEDNLASTEGQVSMVTYIIISTVIAAAVGGGIGRLITGGKKKP